MTDVLSAFLSDVVNDCVNGQTGPTDWTATDAALAVADQAAAETLRQIGASQPVAGGWPVTEEDPSRSLHPEIKGRIVTAGYDPGAA